MNGEEMARYKRDLYSTTPLLGGRTRKLAAEALAAAAQAGNADATLLLADALTDSSDLRVRALADAALRRLTGPTAIDGLCAHWREGRSSVLEDILLEAGYVASDPLYLRVLTALKVGKIEAIAAMNAEAVRALIQATGDPDQTVASRAWEALRQLSGPEAIEAFCDEVLETTSDQLAQIALEKGYAPRDEAARALFFFLTEQWEKYDTLDFQEDRPLLLRGYAAASAAARARFLEVARRSGRSVAWSRAVVGRGKVLRVGAMGDAEWEAVVEGLKQEGRWEEMWRLLFLAPVQWSAEIILAMRTSGAQKALAEGDLPLWDDLVKLCPADGQRALPPGGEHLKTLGHSDLGAVRHLAISPDGRILASGGSQTFLHLWRLPGGEPMRLEGPYAGSRCLAISPDGQLLASGGDDKAVQLWRLPDGARLRCLEGHGARVDALAFSPDGQMLASAGYAESRSLWLWRLPEGQPMKVFDGRRGFVDRLAISPDGQVLAGSGSGYPLWLWRYSDEEDMKPLRGHQGGVTCLMVSPDGRVLVSGGEDKTVRLWPLPDGEPPRTLEGHSGAVLCLAVSPDGRVLASAGADMTVHLWRLPDGAPLKELNGHRGMVWSLAISPDGRVLASAGGDRTVRLWSLPDGRPLRTLDGHGWTIECLAVSPDGRVLASGSYDHTVRLWRIPWSKPLGEAKHADLDYVQEVLKNGQLFKEERRGWEFLEALLRGKFRYDITVEETKIISVGDFDIEIEE